MNGIAVGGPRQFSVKQAKITPNHHSIASLFGLSDNFYADGPPPDENSAFWRAAEKAGIPARVFGTSDFNATVSDQSRADTFIKTMDRDYAEPGLAPPNLILLHLPNDHLGAPRPDLGYPYPESFMADNDLALGRIVEYLSQSPWWGETAVFVTESSAAGGLDHIDAQRTVLLAAGGHARRGYVSHINSDFPGLVRTICKILKIPPIDLADATAAGLGDLFADEETNAKYTVRPPDQRIFGNFH
jgi:hypothetical protein